MGNWLTDAVKGATGVDIDGTLEEGKKKLQQYQEEGKEIGGDLLKKGQKLLTKERTVSEVLHDPEESAELRQELADAGYPAKKGDKALMAALDKFDQDHPEVKLIGKGREATINEDFFNALEGAANAKTKSGPSK